MNLERSKVPKQVKRHTRCGTEVSFQNVTEGYYAQCPKCDEDVYSFEVVQTKAAKAVQGDKYGNTDTSNTRATKSP